MIVWIAKIRDLSIVLIVERLFGGSEVVGWVGVWIGWLRSWVSKYGHLTLFLQEGYGRSFVSKEKLKLIKD